MIDAQKIEERELPAEPVDPPAVATRPERGPVVERTAPALPVRAERIRRYSGDDPAEEELGVRPVIRAARRDEDRKVTHDAHTPGARVGAQSGPLAVEADLVVDGGLPCVLLPIADPRAIPGAVDAAIPRTDARVRIREVSGVRRERRRGAVRRARVVGRTERQHLPPGLPGCMK